jgi:hypothetical protein
VSGDQNSDAEPRQDPTIEKIDELIATLAQWRAVLVQIGDPRDDADGAASMLRAVLPAMQTDKDVARGFVRSGDAEQAKSLFRAAATRRQIDDAVERLYDELREQPLSGLEVRDRVDRYLAALIEKLWIVKTIPGADRAPDALKITPATVAADLIKAVGSRWPEYGARLEKRRERLVDRLTTLQARGRGHPPKGMENAKTAQEVREEILGWIFESADREAVRQYRKRRRK